MPKQKKPKDISEIDTMGEEEEEDYFSEDSAISDDHNPISDTENDPNLKVPEFKKPRNQQPPLGFHNPIADREFARTIQVPELFKKPSHFYQPPLGFTAPGSEKSLFEKQLSSPLGPYTNSFRGSSCSPALPPSIIGSDIESLKSEMEKMGKNIEKIMYMLEKSMPTHISDFATNPIGKEVWNACKKS